MPFSIFHHRTRTLIFIAVLLVYLPSLRNGFIWDDDQYVTQNTTLRSPQGLADIWLHPSATPQYYPLVHSSFWLEYHLWGLTPVGYHLDNILLHAVSCVLLLGLLRRLRVPGAEWAALLFAVHPVMVESVAWVTERKNVLSAVFTLAALGFALRVWDLEDGEPPRLAGEPAPRSNVGSREKRRAGSPAQRRIYAIVVALFVAALLSKTVACTFPIIVLLLIYWRRGRVRLGEMVSLVPLLAVGGGLGLLTAWLEKTHVGASGADWQLSAAQRLMLSGRIVVFYVTKLIRPWPIIFVYPHWTLRPSMLLKWVPLLTVVSVGTGLWLARRRIGRGPGVLMAMFVVTLLPALGFINVFPFRYSFVADHFQYLAAAAVFVAIGWLWARVPKKAGVPIGLGVLLLLATLTWRRQAAYQNLQTLWTDTLTQNPSAWIAWNNLAMLEFDRGDLNAAVDHFRRAGAINPTGPGLQANIGDALLTLNRPEEAEAALAVATAQDPTDALAWRDLGSAREAQKTQDAAARSAYETSIRLNPHDSQTLADLAWLKATSTDSRVTNPPAAMELAKQAEAASGGYSIHAVEAKAAAEAAMGQWTSAKTDATRAAAMAQAAGDPGRANQLRARAAGYAAAATTRPAF